MPHLSLFFGTWESSHAKLTFTGLAAFVHECKNYLAVFSLSVFPLSFAHTLSQCAASSG